MALNASIDNEFYDEDGDDQHVDGAIYAVMAVPLPPLIDESINAVQAVLEGMDVGRDQIGAALLANNMSCDAAVNALLQGKS